MLIDYSSFIDNMGSIAGILIGNGHDKNVTICNNDFSRNTGYISQYNGAGALSVFTSYLELYNTTFVNNRGRDGGALAVQNMHSIVNISRCNFVDNEAVNRGGAVFTISSITIQLSTFSGNGIGNSYSSLRGGGAIYVTGISISIFIQLSRFLSNEAGTGAGGAIYMSLVAIIPYLPIRVNS